MQFVLYIFTVAKSSTNTIHFDSATPYFEFHQTNTCEKQEKMSHKPLLVLCCLIIFLLSSSHGLRCYYNTVSSSMVIQSSQLNVNCVTYLDLASGNYTRDGTSYSCDYVSSIASNTTKLTTCCSSNLCNEAGSAWQGHMVMVVTSLLAILFLL